MPKRYRFSATYEYLDGQPETVRGEYVGKQHHLASKAAYRALKAKYPGRRPCSIVLVLELAP